MKHSNNSLDPHHPTTSLHETTEKNKKAHPPNHPHQSFNTRMGKDAKEDTPRAQRRMASVE
jgi:hypothetical protein